MINKKTQRIQESLYNIYLKGSVAPIEWRSFNNWDDIRALTRELRIPLEEWEYLSPAARLRFLDYCGYFPDHTLDKITETGRYKK